MDFQRYSLKWFRMLIKILGSNSAHFYRGSNYCWVTRTAPLFIKSKVCATNRMTFKTLLRKFNNRTIKLRVTLPKQMEIWSKWKSKSVIFRSYTHGLKFIRNKEKCKMRTIYLTCWVQSAVMLLHYLVSKTAESFLQ